MTKLREGGADDREVRGAGKELSLGKTQPWVKEKKLVENSYWSFLG